MKSTNTIVENALNTPTANDTDPLYTRWGYTKQWAEAKRRNPRDIIGEMRKILGGPCLAAFEKDVEEHRRRCWGRMAHGQPFASNRLRHGICINYTANDRSDWLGLKNTMLSCAGRSDGIGRYQLRRIFDILQHNGADIAKHYANGGQADRIKAAAIKVNTALQKQIDEKAMRLKAWGGRVDAEDEMLKPTHPALAELRRAIAALDPLPNPAEERKRADMEERRRVKSFRDYYRTHDYTGD